MYVRMRRHIYIYGTPALTYISAVSNYWIGEVRNLEDLAFLGFACLLQCF